MDKYSLYLKSNDIEVYEYNLNYKKRYVESIRKVLNDACLLENTTLKGRIDALKANYNFKYNVPIYVNNDIIFLKVSENDTYYLNLPNIVEIENNKKEVTIKFIGGITLNLKINYRTIKERYKAVCQKLHI